MLTLPLPFDVFAATRNCWEKLAPITRFCGPAAIVWLCGPSLLHRANRQRAPALPGCVPGGRASVCWVPGLQLKVCGILRACPSTISDKPDGVENTVVVVAGAP